MCNIANFCSRYLAVAWIEIVAAVAALVAAVGRYLAVAWIEIVSGSAS